jgi:hypothetical protein
MNIFALDYDPQKAATYLCDKHVPKMTVETFQILGSALIRNGAKPCDMPLTSKGTPLKGGYHKHPVVIWAGDSRENFRWTALHGIQIAKEFTLRYNKKHSCENGIRQMLDMADIIKEGALSKFALAMDDQYKLNEPVDSYRNYYIKGKWNSISMKWDKGTPMPAWFHGAINATA